MDDTTAQSKSLDISGQISSPSTSSGTQPSVGSMHKEAGPIRVEQQVSEVLQPSEVEPVLHPEVVEAGVEVVKNPQVPDLTIHDSNAGISHAPSIAPVPTHPSGTVVLPLTMEQSEETLKHKDTGKSITWLAESVLRHLKKMHGKLKGGE